jgi:hypothetical protein
MKVYPSYEIADELREFLINLKIKITSFQDDEEELLRLYSILKNFNIDIQKDILYNLDKSIIRDIKINQVLDETNRNVKTN